MIRNHATMEIADVQDQSNVHVYTDEEVSFNLRQDSSMRRTRGCAYAAGDRTTTDDDAASVASGPNNSIHRDTATNTSFRESERGQSNTTLWQVLNDVTKELNALKQSQEHIRQQLSASGETRNANGLVLNPCAPAYSRPNEACSYNTSTRAVSFNVEEARQRPAHPFDRNCSNNMAQPPVRVEHEDSTRPIPLNCEVREVGPSYGTYGSTPRYQTPRARTRVLGNEQVKIPAFAGKEDWGVWVSRFEAIANRFGWDEEEKLDRLLPRMEGEAAEFIFSQLSPFVLGNYRELVAELHSRFKVIETPRSFAAMFSRRVQRSGESVENYAAELKRLYDKGHGYRDRKTRDEDLVRRFLDGLLDDDARFEVEYHKQPTTIDDAVFHVVNFMQTKKTGNGEKRNKQTRRLLEEDHVYRVPEQGTGNTHNPGHANKGPERQLPQVGEELSQGEILKQILKQLEDLNENQRNRGAHGRSTAKKRSHDNVECFSCQKSGHFSRNCPLRSKVNTQNSPQSTKNGTDRRKEDKAPLNGQGPTFAARRGS